MTRLGGSEIPRLGSCTLVAVDPARAREVWPFVETMLARAYMSGLGDETVEDVREDVFNNRALLWLVWDEVRVYHHGRWHYEADRYQARQGLLDVVGCRQGYSTMA